MPAISPKLPLALDPEMGYQMNKTLVEVVRQNLMMLILTNPGERVMLPDFGVGLKKYLFENISPSFKDEVSQRIHDQVNTYMPAVKINQIIFDDKSMDNNRLNVGIIYSIPSAGLTDTVLVPVNAGSGVY